MCKQGMRKTGGCFTNLNFFSSKLNMLTHTNSGFLIAVFFIIEVLPGRLFK